MFTGIVSDVGEVEQFEQTSSGDVFLKIKSAYDVSTIELGASIACNGICLTVTDFGKTEPHGSWFTADASIETVTKTTIGDWGVGSSINLERPLTLGSELGGHLVTGHIDGKATIVEKKVDGESVRFVFEVSDELAGYIASKGSVALDGTSLTVNEVDRLRFGVNLIQHTLKCTNWGLKETGDEVNLEIDLVARYVVRYNQHTSG